MMAFGAITARHLSTSRRILLVIVIEIKPEDGMLCGILEAFDGSIWFGTSNGVYRYDGSTITDFKSKEVRK